ncbi:MAG: phosphoribosylaminoimidazolesuccinocarboxamide synthase [bacterium]
MGSVKDIGVLEEPTATKCGRARFVFSDRYSVFDWGEMPDLIPQKGASIAILSSYFFEKCQSKGIKTHYIGLVEDDKIKGLSSIKKPTNTMEVRLLRVLKPAFKDGHYDYSIYQREKASFLIPLEIIYRNYLKGKKLEGPMFDVSTKLEATDRYLMLNEAEKIAGLSKEEMDELKKITFNLNSLITGELQRIGLINEDGKIEFGFDEASNFIVVDVFGTLDECRFSYEGIPVSKEIARIYYRRTPWYKTLEEAKNKDRQNFKEICTLKPEPLPERLKLLISQIYCACCNEITKKEWFPAPPLKEAIKEIKEFI